MGGWLRRGRKARRRGACRLPIRLMKELVRLGCPAKLGLPHVQGCRPMGANSSEMGMRHTDRAATALAESIGGSTLSSP